ncbi:hypothetical protein [Alkalicoccus daliensis]|uniref:hypothetical protein n=1 Tax=Alkalicoccus daliensis TaxID=745820 RepID=UPI000B848F1C|nr:hypothetical protein [Alkalicoccus daliensis]
MEYFLYIVASPKKIYVYYIHAAVAEGRLQEELERFEDPSAKGRLAERVPSGKRAFGDKSIEPYTYTEKLLFNSL